MSQKDKNERFIMLIIIDIRVLSLLLYCNYKQVPFFC